MEVEILHLGEVKFEAIVRGILRGAVPQEEVPIRRWTENQGYGGKGDPAGQNWTLASLRDHARVEPEGPSGHSPGRKILSDPRHTAECAGRRYRSECARRCARRLMCGWAGQHHEISGHLRTGHSLAFRLSR